MVPLVACAHNVPTKPMDTEPMAIANALRRKTPLRCIVCEYVLFIVLTPQLLSHRWSCLGAAFFSCCSGSAFLSLGSRPLLRRLLATRGRAYSSASGVHQ